MRGVSWCRCGGRRVRSVPADEKLVRLQEGHRPAFGSENHDKVGRLP